MAFAVAWGSLSMALIQQVRICRKGLAHFQPVTLVILVSMQGQYGQHHSSRESPIGQGAEQPVFWMVLSLARAG